MALSPTADSKGMVRVEPVRCLDRPPVHAQKKRCQGQVLNQPAGSKMSVHALIYFKIKVTVVACWVEPLVPVTVRM